MSSKRSAIWKLMLLLVAVFLLAAAVSCARATPTAEPTPVEEAPTATKPPEPTATPVPEPKELVISAKVQYSENFDISVMVWCTPKVVPC